jgi:murein DD-endopeptidase MepM/ murein hydrolase activator NlpD
LAPALAVRGRVLRGGKNAPQPICGKWAHGGGGLQVGIEVLHNGTWKSVGWVLYGHVQDMTVDDGDVLENPTSIAKVTALHDNNYCSTGGHLHLGFSDTTHHPCWSVARRVPTDSPIAQVGGNRESFTKCSM